VKAGHIPLTALDRLRSGGGQKAFRRSVVDLWRGGLRDYVFKR